MTRAGDAPGPHRDPVGRGAGFDVTGVWLAGTRGHLTHASRAPLVHAHGRVGLALAAGGDGEPVERVLADMAPVSDDLSEALAIVDELIVAVRAPEGEASEDPPDLVALAAAVAASHPAPEQMAGGEGGAPAGAPWRVEHASGGGAPTSLTSLTVEVPTSAGDLMAPLTTLCSWLVARWDLTCLQVVRGDEVASLRDVPAGSGASVVAGTVPLHDPELAQRRVARSLREVPSVTAVRIALATARLATAGVTLVVGPDEA